LENIGTTIPGLVFNGQVASQRLGDAVAGAGDVDGTGSTELLLGAPGDPAAPPNPGTVYITVPIVTGEATDLELTGGATATLEWTKAVGAIRHRVYRGAVSTLLASGGVHTSSTTCLTPGAVSDSDANSNGRPDLVDIAVPGVGSGFWYVVSGASDLGEGPLGTDSTGALRRNDGPCP